MGKKKKQPKHNSSIDLRRRAKIIIEPAVIDKLSKEELVERIKAITYEVNVEHASDNELEFMLVGPRMKAIKRMKAERRVKLAIK